MKEFESAITVINTINTLMGTEKVSLLNAYNRVLADDIISDTDQPPFDKSAMDGYACRKEDLNEDLTVVDEIPAGRFSRIVIGKCQCARIMTGAPLPEGADYVLMKEHAEITGPETIRCIKSSEGSNICLAGEDIKAGSTVLEKGTFITAAQISVLASVGCMDPEVYKIPGVAILSTGSELTHPSVNPQKGKIRNSNGFQVAAQLLQNDISATDLGIVVDNENTIQNILAEAIDKYDLTIVTGGVSVGDYDYVPGILKRLGVEEIIRGLRIKPGKHILLGIKNNHYIAALPGNPVSVFVLTEVLIKPLLNRLTGAKGFPGGILLPMEMDFRIKNTDILHFIPVQITLNGTVKPVEYHGSAHIHSYTMADGIMEIPAGKDKVNKGEKVNVRPL